MARSKVAVLKTHPDTVVDDYKKLMKLAEYEKYVRKDRRVCLKINVSWQIFYPGCSTTPWQLDGVIKTLLDDGYPKENLYGCHNRTVVVDGKIGEVNNKQKQIVVGKYGLKNHHLQPETTPDIRTLPYLHNVGKPSCCYVCHGRKVYVFQQKKGGDLLQQWEALRP